jgi:hypothetical protein
MRSDALIDFYPVRHKETPDTLLYPMILLLLPKGKGKINDAAISGNRQKHSGSHRLFTHKRNEPADGGDLQIINFSYDIPFCKPFFRLANPL